MKHIFGSWQDLQGNKAAKGQLHLKLNQDAVVPATSQAAPREIQFQLDSNGALGASAMIWANDELLPTGTYYILTVTAFGGGTIWGPQNIYIAGSDPIDLNLAIPLPGIAAIETFAAAGQSVVFTRPPLQAGVFAATLSDLTTWSPNAFATVSDQFVLAGASGISIIASKSLDSLTASIVASFDTESFPRFSAAALGSTVTNQLVLVGGSNVSLSNSTDSNGMTVNFNVSADIEITTNPLSLVAGSNISFVQSGNTAGTTITINASVGSVSLFAGSNITLSSALNTAGSSYTIAGASGAGGAVSLVQGSNVSLQSSTAPGGATYTINASNNIFSAGALGPIVTNQLMLEPGNNITLSTFTDTVGMTVSINGAAGGTGGGGGAGVGIAAAGPGSIVGAASGSTLITNRMMLVPANNITFYTATDTGAMSVFVSGSSAQAANVALVAAGGSVLGATGPIQPNNWSIQAGPNITLSGQTDILSNLQLLISGGAGGTGGAGFTGGIIGGNTSGTFGTVNSKFVLYGGSNITIAGATDASEGMTASIRGNTPFGVGMSSGGAGSTAGNSGASLLTGPFRIVAGSNITLSAASDTNSGYTLTINAALGTGGTISGGNMSIAQGSLSNIIISSVTNTGGSTFTLNAAQNNFVASGNISITTASNTHGSTITIADIAAGAFSGGMDGFITNVTASATTTGFSGPVTNQLLLAAGSNITLSGNTDTNGMTVSVNAPSPLGATSLQSGSFAPATPLVFFQSSFTAFATSRAYFWPFMQGILGSGMTQGNLIVYLALASLTDHTGTVGVSLGVYGQNSNSLTMLSSGFLSSTWSLVSANVGNVQSGRELFVPINMNFTAKQNWMGFRMSTSISGVAGTMSVLAGYMVASATNVVGPFGSVSNLTFQRIAGWGYLSSTQPGMPVSCGFTDLTGATADAIFAPIIHLAGYQP